MSIRLLLCDVDGTLVRHDKSLGLPVVDAVARCQAAGVPVSIISARPMSGMLWIAERLKIVEPMAAFNGGTIFDADGQTRAAEHIAPDAAARALAMLEKPGIDRWLFADGKWYAQTGEGDHAARERGSAGIEPTVVQDFAGLTARADKIVGVCDDHALLAMLEPELADGLGDHAHVSRSQAYYLDVTAPQADKGHGVAALAKGAGVSLDEVAVIGDQRNDMPMFARAGLSIAMSQGPDEVRAAATHVTLSNDEDGVAHAIDAWILPVIGARP